MTDFPASRPARIGRSSRRSDAVLRWPSLRFRQAGPESEPIDRQFRERALGLGSLPAQERLDGIVAMLREVFEMPMAAITFIDDEHCWVKAGAGIGTQVETPRAEAFCHYTVQQPGALVFTDAAVDDRVAQLPTVQDGLRFYAGHPLRAPSGERVGSLCLMDTTTRTFTAAQQTALAEIALIVETELAPDRPLDATTAAQQALTPGTAPQVPGYDLAGRCTPARQVDGSFFDWYWVEDQVLLQVADVIGAGASAAPIAAVVRALLRAGGHHPDQHEAVDQTVNAAWALLEGTATFVTAFSASLEPATGQLTYVSAGPGMAVVLDAHGGCRQLAPSGPPLGMSHTAQWPMHTTELHPGEILLILGDSYVDLGPGQQRLRLQALREILARYRGRLDVHQAVDLATAWAVEHGHPTDITILALQRHHQVRP